MLVASHSSPSKRNVKKASQTASRSFSAAVHRPVTANAIGLPVSGSAFQQPAS